MSERLVGDGAVGALGAALAWSLAGPALGGGGLAPLAVTALAAITLGLPLASLERTAPLPASPRAAMATAFADGVAWVWALALAAAALGGLSPALGGAPGVVVSVVALTFAAPRGGRTLVAALLGAGAAAAITLGSWDAAASGGPWTLLTPTWEGWATWSPAAVAGGLALAGAGFGRWQVGTDRSPAAVAGLALAVALAGALGVASVYEVGGTPGAIPPLARQLGHALGALAVAAATLAPAADGPRQPPWLAGIALVIGALAFAGPLAPARSAFFSSVLLLGPACVAATRAFVRRDPAAAALAAGLTAVGVLGWPGLPQDAVAAAALAALPVTALWVGGLAAVRLAPEAP